MPLIQRPVDACATDPLMLPRCGPDYWSLNR